MSENNVDLKLLGICLNIPEFMDSVKLLNSPIVIEKSLFYVENINTIFKMLALQITLMSATVDIMQFEFNRVYLLLQDGYSYEEANYFGKLAPEIKQTINKKALEALQNLSIGPEATEVKHKRLVKIITKITNENEFQKPLQALYYSAITLGWMAFESLLADLWEAIVNENPARFGANALKVEVSEQKKQNGEIAANQPLGLSSKQIEFWLLEKHNFNLQNIMGTILKDKFDFTRIAGIKTAYKEIFPLHKDKIDKILNDKNLSELHLVRNLIAHRGGKVDEKYIKATNSIIPLGFPLQIDGEKLSILLNASIDSTAELLKLLDSIIALDIGS